MGATWPQWAKKMRRVFQFPVHGDKNVRRQWLAGVLLLFLFILALLALVNAIFYFWPFNNPDNLSYTLFVAAMTGLLALLWAVNRSLSFSRFTRPLTVLLLAVGILFSDSPESVVWGSSFSLFALPILSASFILSPAASFVVALLINLEVQIFASLTVPGREIYPIYDGISLLAIAGVAWLAAASLESVLDHLEELVAERTESLKKTVARLTEATQTIQAYSEQMELTNTRLEQANLFKNLFLASFRDELEAPLTAILQASANVSDELSTGILRNPELARIHRNGRFLQALINYILDLGDLEMGTLKLERTSVDLIPLLRSTAQLLDEQLALKKQQLNLDIPQQTAYAFVDRRRIEQVLVNLLSTASKFSPAGSEISVSLHERPNGVWQLSVRDSGPGISPEHVNRMFQPFKRLGVSRRILEMHEGKLWLDTLTGGGANFILQLPASRA